MDAALRRSRHSVIYWLILVVIAYASIAYLMAPYMWLRYERHHPALSATPDITVTADKHPGDPINVALVGSEDDLKQLLASAEWKVSDPLGLRSDLRIAADTVIQRPYETAPVSNLFLYGRKEDIAFEKPVGNSPSKRHHVRFWKSQQNDDQGRPLWAGAVTYDRSVGLSHTTGQITHHIDGDVDAERDRFMEEMNRTGRLVSIQVEPNFHKTRSGTNGGGDRWTTDGKLLVGTMLPAQQR